MKLPDLPNVPIDMDEETIAYLNSLEGRLDTIEVARVEGDNLTVLGKYTSKGFPFSRTHVYEVVRNSETGEENVAHFRKPLDMGEPTFFGALSALATEAVIASAYDLTNISEYVSNPVTEAIFLAGLIPFAAGISYELLMPSVRKGRRQLDEHYRRVRQYIEANLADIREKIEGINVYQGTVGEVERETGKHLERVDIGRPETFLKARDTFWLRVEAYLRGADAVVHYQPGSSIGTPVRYSDKKV